jgi:hypothetical protein
LIRGTSTRVFCPVRLVVVFVVVLSRRFQPWATSAGNAKLSMPGWCASMSAQNRFPRW